MRSFITTSVLITGALAQSTQDYLQCASAALGSADVSKFSDCTNKPAHDCFCANKDAISSLSTSAEKACSGIDLNALTTSLCETKSETKSDSPAAPARHASKPMQPADMKRAFAPEAEPRVVYVTETRTECSCKSTPVPERPAHVSQIPVDVPASSSMGAMVAGATPSYSHGVLVSSSSVLFGSQASATPSPSGVDPSRFSSFEGAAAPGVAVHGAAAVLCAAAVMGFMAAL